VGGATDELVAVLALLVLCRISHNNNNHNNGVETASG
jgi:hypothetical protein